MPTRIDNSSLAVYGNLFSVKPQKDKKQYKKNDMTVYKEISTYGKPRLGKAKPQRSKE